MKKIELTQGKFALIDDEDYNQVVQDKWFAHFERGRFYAWRSRHTKPIRMHHIILGIPSPGLEIDHIDGNGLNNQKMNLRFVNRSQNNMNRSKKSNTSSRYKGVQWNAHKNKWYAELKYNNKRYCLGYFDSEINAAKERDCFGFYLCRAFVRFNFPDFDYQSHILKSKNLIKLKKAGVLS